MRPLVQGFSHQLLNLIRVGVKWAINPMQVNPWVATVQQQNEDRKPGPETSPEGKLGAVISQAKNLSKDSRSFLFEGIPIDLGTVHMLEKPDGTEPRRGQEKNDQACRRYQGGPLELEQIVLGSFRATSEAHDL